MAKNKVVYGFSNLHVGTWSYNEEGAAVLGTPYHQIGAVGFSPSQDSDTTNFAADDIDFWSYISEGVIEGDLIVANFDDEFRTQFLGWAANTNGAQVLSTASSTRSMELLSRRQIRCRSALLVIMLPASCTTSSSRATRAMTHCSQHRPRRSSQQQENNCTGGNGAAECRPFFA